MLPARKHRQCYKPALAVKMAFDAVVVVVQSLMGTCVWQAVTHYNDPKMLAEVSCGLGEPMVGIDCRDKNFNSYAARSE